MSINEKSFDTRRVALCFTGRVKCFEDSLNWFNKNFLENRELDVDVFCSINGSRDSYNDSFLQAFKVKRWYFNEYTLPYSASIFSHNKRPETNVYNLHSMLYNKKQCFHLIKQTQEDDDIRYDLILFFRADILPFENDFVIPDLIQDTNAIYIPEGYDWGGYNDQIAHGNFDVMQKYCELYDKVIFYCLHEGCIFHPESLLKFHLDKSGVSVCRYKFAYKLNDKRV